MPPALGGRSPAPTAGSEVSCVAHSFSQVSGQPSPGTQPRTARRLGLTEEILWQQLRGSQLGVAFRRQVPVGRYIGDFLAHSVKLIIEVDGGYHATPAGRRADARRDRYLARLGYRVVRLPAAMVQRELAQAVALIAAALRP